MQLTKTAQQSIATLTNSLQAGIDAWERAGEEVVRLVDDHGMSLEDICAAANSDIVTVSVLAQFERIGRKQVMPRLLVAEYPAANSLQKLPMSEQQRLLNGSVELVTMKAGKTDVLSVAVQDLTRQQCRQVFDRNSVRSLGAQRAWLEAQATEQELVNIKATSQTPWVVRSGRVLFREGCELSRHELAVILAQVS